MSREIKFRAWNGECIVSGDWFWVSGSGIVFIDSAERYDAPNSIERAKNYVLMQYTGLKDKNGKEIYEGDILKHNDNIFTLDWTDEVCAVFGFHLTDIRFGKGNRNWRDFVWASKLRKHIEVIGNIYENPELLK